MPRHRRTQHCGWQSLVAILCGFLTFQLHMIGTSRPLPFHPLAKAPLSRSSLGLAFFSRRLRLRRPPLIVDVVAPVALVASDVSLSWMFDSWLDPKCVLRTFRTLDDVAIYHTAIASRHTASAPTKFLLVCRTKPSRDECIIRMPQKDWDQFQLTASPLCGYCAVGMANRAAMKLSGV